MINLKKGDLLILDFDDTIWIWKRNETYIRPDFLKMRINGETAYSAKYGRILPAIRNYISYALATGATVVVLSTMSNTYEYLDKCNIMEKEFNLDRCYIVGVSSNKDKPTMISYLMNHYNVSKDNTHFVDDNKEILYSCKDLTGVNIYTSLELA